MWQVFVVEGDQVISTTSLSGRNEAVVEENIAKFSVNLSGSAGTAKVMIEVGYGYCSNGNTGLCRLASNVWAFPLTVSGDSKQNTIALSFKGANASSSESDDE